MGFSCLTWMMALACLAILLVSAIIHSQSTYDGVYVSARQRADILEKQERETVSYLDYNSTNVSDTTVNATFYFDNTGETNIRVSCIDLYVDGSWVDGLDGRPFPEAFDSMLCNPGEQLRLSTAADYSVGEHNATVVFCSGKTASVVFNASVCGDGACTGNEFCDRDNTSCQDNICFEPRCWRGCIEINITGAQDPGECDDTGAGCATDSCLCSSTSQCCGADDSSGCSSASDCCSGVCTGGVCGTEGMYSGVPESLCCESDGGGCDNANCANSGDNPGNVGDSDEADCHSSCSTGSCTNVDVGTSGNSYIELDFPDINVPSEESITGASVTIEYSEEASFTDDNVLCWSGLAWTTISTDISSVQSDRQQVYVLSDEDCYKPAARANDIKIQVGYYASTNSGKFYIDFAQVNVTTSAA